jgi:hypothetical protein
MAKEFDIHKWQAEQKMKQWLAEQEEFTPDLEDDDLKRGAIQQMMDKEKENASKSQGLTIKKVVDQSMNNDDIGKLQDVIRNNNLGKILNTIAVILDRSGNAPEGASQMIADLVPYIDLADPTVTSEDEELDENMTGTGASMQAGEGMGHFGKSKKKRKNTRSGYMGYSEPVKEQEESSEEEKSLSLGDAVDTNTELGAQLKSFGSQLKTPEGAKGFDKSEIEMLSQLLIALSDSIQTGNATTILKRMISLI